MHKARWAAIAALTGLLSLAPTSAEAGTPAFGTGGGPFAGTITYAADRCVDGAAVSMTAVVAFTTIDLRHYEGPLTLTGTAEDCGGPLLLRLEVLGTDALGRTLHCPVVEGAGIGTGWWTMGAGPAAYESPCTLNGEPFDHFTFWALGTHAPAPGTSAVSGFLGVTMW